jgi:hypothetical protein
MKRITLRMYALTVPFAVLSCPAALGTALPTPRDAFGPHHFVAPWSPETQLRHGPAGMNDATARLLYWNEVALSANALDHTPPPPGSSRTFGEQLGPGRTSRALAIVQLAVFDALCAISGRYPTYTGMSAAPSDSSVDAAIAKAAYDTLTALYPSQAASLTERYQLDLHRIANGRAKNNGVESGRRAAAAILALRAADGVQYDEPRVGIDFLPDNQPGTWRPDPVSMATIALGAHWHYVKPFVLPSTQAFWPAPPPALSSGAYATAFNEVKHLGGDGITTPTRRTQQQTIAGVYWGYDGTAGLGTPPRLFNQIAVEIAKKRPGVNTLELARVLAQANVAMADTCIVLWEVKYHYQFWRPVTGIRESVEGTGPTGLGDGNPATHGAPNWTPLGAPASNLTVANFTPPFPAYPSGHAGLGSALFQTLRNVYGTDQIAFTFVSDEYNGVTRDNHGAVRPRLPRGFATLSQAEEENGQSRIYLGIHWAFDKTEGFEVGRHVANYIYRHGLVRPDH